MQFFAFAAIRQRHYVFRCPYGRPLTPISRNSLFGGGISMKLGTNVYHVRGNRDQWSKVKVMCVRMCECGNGGGIHFDGVAASLTCFEY